MKDSVSLTQMILQETCYYKILGLETKDKTKFQLNSNLTNETIKRAYLRVLT
jgi:hypothetical protein